MFVCLFAAFVCFFVCCICLIVFVCLFAVKLDACMFSLVPRNRTLCKTNNDDVAFVCLFVCFDGHHDKDENDDDDHFRLILFMFRRNWPSGLNSQAAQTTGKEGSCSK